MTSALPHHLAIIMDGNRRWAKQRGMPIRAGHMQGSATVEHIVEHAHQRGITWLTLFAFSTENWSRPAHEVKDILGVFRYFLDRKGKALIDKNVRLRTIGDLAAFPLNIQKKIAELVERSASNTGINLTVALNYGGQSDLMLAAKAIAANIAAGRIDAADIDENAIKQHLYTAELPAIDLLIRTSNEKRLSNFMLWDMAYAELMFMPVLWPDFGAGDLDQALEDYAMRERRFGCDGMQVDNKNRYIS